MKGTISQSGYESSRREWLLARPSNLFPTLIGFDKASEFYKDLSTTTLWEGTGDFTSGALTAENLTLVQLGSGRIAESGSILNSIVSGSFLPSAPLLLWTDVDGSDQVLGTGSFSADPVFAETETYSLSPMSPCIDAGSGVDADGSVRDLGWLPRG